MAIDELGFEPELSIVIETGAVASIIAVLLDIRDEPHSVSDICDLAGIGRSTFYEHADRLEAYGILEKINLGSASGYRLAETEVAAALIELERQLEAYQQAPGEGGDTSNSNGNGNGNDDNRTDGAEQTLC